MITPKNYALAAINASVGLGGGYNFIRAFMYHQNHPEQSLKAHEKEVLTEGIQSEKMASKLA